MANTNKKLELMVERLRELILEDEEFIKYVDQEAQNGLDSFMDVFPDVCISPAVRDELICQYQTNTWYKVLNMIGEI